MKKKLHNVTIWQKVWWSTIDGHTIFTATIILIFATALYFAIVPPKWKIEQNEKEIYRNEKLLIVGTNENAQDFTHDKFHEPIIIKVWLVQRINDTTQFAEITSTWSDKMFYITNELWYSKGIGDTLHFDYIRRDRFFTIKK